MFQRYIGIDYSGAGEPTKGNQYLRVYVAEGADTPTEQSRPDGSRSQYWSRKQIAEWLVSQLRGDVPTLVGIDHGFFPFRTCISRSTA